MKRFSLTSVLFALAAFLPAAHAQWQSITYTLRGGWNAIYLHGDANHATIEQILSGNPEVVSIWRWNANASQIQFGTSSIIPAAGTPDWSIWTRGNSGLSTLASLNGQTAYLIECTGGVGNTYSIPIPQKVQPPRSTWVRNGANLLGFPTRLNTGVYPLFSNYFATFPVAIAANTKIYQYVGGPLGAGNPIQVFAPASERIDRTQAYWFEAAVVGSFYAPLEISPSNLDGLHFGRTGSLITVRVRNRTAAAVTLTVTPVDSAPAPAGQESITAVVPLTSHAFDTNTATYVDTPVNGAFNQVIGPQSAIELSFGVNRAQIIGAVNALYASLLRFTESSNLMDVALPVSARVTSLAGLWVGDIALTGVQSNVPGSPGTTTARPFPLRAILHVDDNGTARLLSQVFMGRLAPAPYTLGICTHESALKADEKANATRLVAAHLPLDTEIATGEGSVTLGATLVRTITLPFNGATNPFVHAYHPDHDNKDARFQPLASGVESQPVSRACSFTFAAAAPAGSSSIGSGSSVIGGAYSETIIGLHKAPVTITGTFELRRVSEIGAITTN